MRVINIIHSLDPARGGPAEGLRQMCMATRRLGHRQDVVTMDPPDAPWIETFPARVVALGGSHTTYGYSPKLHGWLQRNSPLYDGVVVHGLWQFHGLATWWTLRRTQVPYYVFPHGMLDPWFRRSHPIKHLKKALYWWLVERHVLGRARHVLFTADEEARLAAQTFGLYRASPCTVGYGVALDAVAAKTTADDFLEAWPQLRGRRLLTFLGRIHPKKGPELLLEAFARHAARDERLALVMAGPDQVGMVPVLTQRAAELGLADRVVFTGMLQGRLKWGCLRAAEAFVLPSHQENFGIAVAEALAVGTPVLISTQVNIWREIVEDEAGLAEVDTQAGTDTLLGRWLDLPEHDRHAMRQRAADCFGRRFHIDAAARTFVRVVEQQDYRAASQTCHAG